MLEVEPISSRAQEMALGAYYAENPSFAIEQTTAIESLTGEELDDEADRYLILERSRALLLEPGSANDVAELGHESRHDGGGDGTERVVKRPAGIDFADVLGVDSVAWIARSNASALEPRARALDRALHR